jgi:predicted MPP superfamily phosphohydrolase
MKALKETTKPLRRDLPAEFNSLAARLGHDVLAKRLLLQAKHYARLQHQGEGIFKFEKYVSFDALLTFLLQVLMLAKRGERNALAIRVVELEWSLERLPASFEGFRLLQLTDLHADLHPHFAASVAAVVRSVQYDAVVITGDFRNSTDDDFGPALAATHTILSALSAPCFGVLGNHDFIEMVDPIEDMGCRMLLNETTYLERNGERLWLAGVDDPHFYQTHDLAKTRAEIPPDAASVLLAHSPEVAESAASLGFSLMLSGHTHGGQICLPGGYAPILPVRRLARDLVKGAWRRATMQGYTSPGTGACGVAARFNCPPEVTVHILRSPHARAGAAA